MNDQRFTATEAYIKARVLLIYTGGTIGMAPKDPGNPASPLEPKSLDDLLQFVPQFTQQKHIHLGYEAFETPLDSSDIEPLHWVEMARIIRKHYDEYDGFVILHGTDTMAYTSSALAFILNNLAKPVVITGSQLPISEVRTDAVQNLVAAIHIAGYKAVDLPRIPEVVLCFADKILRGCRVTKVSTHDWAGFDSPNFPPLGTIGEHIRINTRLIWEGPKEGEDFYISEEIATEVMQKIEVLELGLFPGFKASQLKTILGLPNVKGVVMRTFGNGNAPGNPQFLKVINDAIHGAEPRIILNVTKCPKGMVEMGVYAASIELLERGVISGLDMTGEAAMAKLFWTLGTQTGSGISAQLQINQRGEQSENLFDLHYGAGGSMEEPVDKFTCSIAPDSRLLRPKLSRSVVRLSGAGFSGIKHGHLARVRIFMNHPGDSSATPADDPHCVAEFIHLWEGEPATLIQDISEKTTEVMGQGDIMLTVVPLDGVKMWFKGLYLALFSEAAF